MLRTEQIGPDVNAIVHKRKQGKSLQEWSATRLYVHIYGHESGAIFPASSLTKPIAIVNLVDL